MPPKLEEPSVLHPPGQLAPHVGRVHVAGEEEARLEDRLVLHDREESGETHSVNMP